MELLTVKSHCVVCYSIHERSDGDEADSSYDVMTVSRTSKSHDSITNVQMVRSIKQRWFFFDKSSSCGSVSIEVCRKP